LTESIDGSAIHIIKTSQQIGDRYFSHFRRIVQQVNKLPFEVKITENVFSSSLFKEVDVFMEFFSQ
jgi:hypothetical protein